MTWAKRLIKYNYGVAFFGGIIHPPKRYQFTRNQLTPPRGVVFFAFVNYNSLPYYDMRKK